MKIGKILLSALCLCAVAFCTVYIVKREETRDTVPPELIFASDSITASVHAAQETLLEGVTARDDTDGEISDRILIEKVAKDPSPDGRSFDVSYAVFDAAGNYAEATRTVVYEDYHVPQFNLRVPLRFAEGKSFNLSKMFQVTDVFGNDLMPYVTLEAPEDLEKGLTVGEFPCKISVKDSYGGESTVPFNVSVYSQNDIEEELKATIVLTDYVVYLKAGETFDSRDYLSHIVDGSKVYIDFDGTETAEPTGDEKSKDGKTENEQPQTPKTPKYNAAWVSADMISFKSDLDTAVPGLYEGKYTYLSGRTNIEATTTIYIVVE